MFYACVQRFDGMDEKILGDKLNRALMEHRRKALFMRREYTMALFRWFQNSKNL